MTDATKIASVLAAARDDERAQELFDIADAIVADGAIAVSGGKTSYSNGAEAVLNFLGTRAGAGALVVGTPIVLGTLVAGLRPAIACEGIGYCVTDTGARPTGAITVSTAGVVSFVPNTAAASGSGFVFHVPGVHVGPPSSLVSDDVV